MLGFIGCGSVAVSATFFPLHDNRFSVFLEVVYTGGGSVFFAAGFLGRHR